MKTDFDYNSMPVSFAHCLNGHCLRADKCLRRQVSLRMPKERATVMVINPEHIASDGGDCTYFIDEKPVLFARGYQTTDDGLLRQNDLLPLLQQGTAD